MENYKYLWVLEADTFTQLEMKETIGRVPQTNKKSSRNEALLQRFNQRNKHLNSSPCNIFGTILKMEQLRPQTNWPEDNKVDKMYMVLHSWKSMERLCVRKKEEKVQH